MSESPPTLSDVAKLSGVSLTTASFALSGKGNISHFTREKVKHTAASLGYMKPTQHRRIRKKHKRVVYLMDTDSRWAHIWFFTAPTFNALRDSLSCMKIELYALPFSSNRAGAAESERRLLREIKAIDADAVASMHHAAPGLFRKLLKTGRHVVLLNNSELQSEFDTVCVDDFQGAYEGARYLIGLGHRRILFIEYDRPDVRATQADRFIGFKKAMDEAALPLLYDDKITIKEKSPELLDKHIELAFADGINHSAIFAHDDHLAAMIVGLLAKRGIRVPEDISILAPGDVLDYTQPYIPQITTMRIDTETMGQMAAHILQERLNGDRNPQAKTLKVRQHLVSRGSCREWSSRLQDI